MYTQRQRWRGTTANATIARHIHRDRASDDCRTALPMTYTWRAYVLLQLGYKQSSAGISGMPVKGEDRGVGFKVNWRHRRCP